MTEFACTHCGETNSNLQDLRTHHWAKMHPELPFYFRVQPQLLCSECKRFKGNAKTLRDDHLIKVHSLRNIVACDVRRPEECAYCNYRYTNRQDLMVHINREGHLPNDLKNVTDAELDALQQLSSCGAATNEYYQCDLCSVVMPTMSAIAQHGCVEHSRPSERFCFRKLTASIIYHCFYCIFTSTNELATLRHMLDHYNRFFFCHFCTASQGNGFDQYLQHCYVYHREDLARFRMVHTYADLRKYLMQVHYQFQNGLIITKSSLRNTRYNYDRVMLALDRELMSKVQAMLVPRPAITIKDAVGNHRHQQQQPKQPLLKIRARRKTVTTADELSRVVREEPHPQPHPQLQSQLQLPINLQVVSVQQQQQQQEPISLAKITKRRKTVMSSDEVVKIAWQENNVERQVSFVVKPQATPPPTNVHQQQQQQLQLQEPQQQQQQQQISLAKITKRRKTVTAADELMRIAREQNREQEMETLTVTVETEEPQPGTSQQQQDPGRENSCLIRILKRRQSYVVRTGPENSK